jgi:hypothetical protein
MDHELTLAELDSEEVELLPTRETLCYGTTINVTNVFAINLAVAVNVGSFQSSAGALADQVLVVLSA